MRRDAQRGEQSASSAASDGSSSGKRTKLDLVLVVDDLEDNRELYSYGLEREGFAVQTARDGAEALELAVRMHPSLVVMDLAMPVMDGWEATRRMRRIPALADTPIIALTAFTDARTRAEAFAAGCDECLTKPYAPSDLAARVRSLLHAPRALASGSAE